ncbi:unnamed protein product [Rangifer tarandus platyrhynchus]|uniref:Uncharacterized protein n=1 Tax=Rangifer tarandus platyrhynchus TaxID=3082113 RepID=A0AC59Y8C8_RANTA
MPGGGGEGGGESTFSTPQAENTFRTLESISRLRPPFPGRVSAAASPELRGVATGGGGRSGFVQNLGTWKKRQPPHPHLHPAEAFPERLGDAVGRRERLDRWVRGAGVRRARVYLGAA